MLLPTGQAKGKVGYLPYSQPLLSVRDDMEWRSTSKSQTTARASFSVWEYLCTKGVIVRLPLAFGRSFCTRTLAGPTGLASNVIAVSLSGQTYVVVAFTESVIWMALIIFTPSGLAILFYEFPERPCHGDKVVDRVKAALSNSEDQADLWV